MKLPKVKFTAVGDMLIQRIISTEYEGFQTDTPTARVALISMTSSFVAPSAMAGRQSRRVIGRPGVNALRTNKHIEVTDEQFEMLSQIAEINDEGIGIVEV